ncbi:ATP-binding protein [Actinoplanes sp. NPDC026670]|uniref:ATP-binding protein n=1 Tax=Actinoplanes sp. NPDC026670 TaxID=3154700 RepID=UPI0034085079
MAIRCDVRGDGAGVIATLSGELQLTDRADLRESLLKCLAEQPGALLVDLSALTVRQPLALSIFKVVLRQAARWPGTPIMFCAPGPDTRELLTAAAGHRLPLYPSVAAALAHLHDQRVTVPSISEELLPVSGSTRHARDIATETCLRWDLPALVAPASLIVTELVANAVDHADTMMTLRLSLRQRYLYIAVRDGSSQPPAPAPEMPPPHASGRGLLLVNELAYSWGYLPSTGGKVVWAALRRH